jgi:signal transduction histidine kinase
VFATANLRRAPGGSGGGQRGEVVARTASHELRTPLAVIVWLAELLKDPTLVPPDRFARSLTGIRRSADELLRTTEAVLNLSRLDHPDAMPVWEPIHLAGTIREVLDNLQPLAEKKQLKLRLAIAKARH